MGKEERKEERKADGQGMRKVVKSRRECQKLMEGSRDRPTLG